MGLLLLKSIPSDTSMLSYSNIYVLCKHSPEKDCGEYLLPSWKRYLATLTCYKILVFSLKVNLHMI